MTNSSGKPKVTLGTVITAIAGFLVVCWWFQIGWNAGPADAFGAPNLSFRQTVGLVMCANVVWLYATNWATRAPGKL